MNYGLWGGLIIYGTESCSGRGKKDRKEFFLPHTSDGLDPGSVLSLYLFIFYFYRWRWRGEIGQGSSGSVVIMLLSPADTRCR